MNSSRVSPTLVRRAGVAVVLAAWTALSSCDGPRADLKEWTQADHNNAAANPRGTVPAEPGTAAAQQDTVIAVTWKNNCLSCHGVVGRGDGPQGPMLKTRDLTDPQWQASVTDAQIVAVLSTGKGKMPAFNLPEPTVEALVKLIRAMGAPPSAGGHGGAAAELGGAPVVAAAPGAVGGAGVEPPAHGAAAGEAGSGRVQGEEVYTGKPARPAGR